MDEVIRALERERENRPEDRGLAERLAGLYERAGWTFRGKTIQQWIDELADPKAALEAAEAIRDLGLPIPRASEPLLKALLASAGLLRRSPAFKEALLICGLAGLRSELIALSRAPIPPDQSPERGRRVHQLRCALILLAADGSKDALAAILRKLDEASDIARRFAILALGQTGRAEATPRLIPLLRGEDREEVCAAATALGLLKARAAVPELARLVDSNRQAELIAACQALAAIADPPAVTVLDRSLDRNPNQAPRLIQALEKHPSPAGDSLLIRALSIAGLAHRSIGTGDHLAPATAARLLPRLARDQAADPEPSRLELLAWLTATLEAAEGSALPELAEREALTEQLLAALPQLAPPLRKSFGLALRALVTATRADRLRPLLEPDATRFPALLAFRGLAEESDLPRLLFYLRGPDMLIAAAAAEVLGALGSAVAVRSLVKAARGLGAGPVAAIRALGQIDHDQARAALEELAAAEQHPVRLRAIVEALARQPGARGLAFIERVAEDPRDRRRALALEVLIEVRGRAVIPRLRALLDQPEDDLLQIIAIDALGRLGDLESRERIRSRSAKLSLQSAARAALRKLDALDRMRPPESGRG